MFIPDEILQAAYEGGWNAHRGEAFDQVIRLGRHVQLISKKSGRCVEAETIILDKCFWLGLQCQCGLNDWWDVAHRVFDAVLDDGDLIGLWAEVLEGK